LTSGSAAPPAIEPFELFAIRYANHSGRHQSDNFLGGDSHETGADLDYFVWVARRSERTFVIDTGFDQAAANERKRTLLRAPAIALKLLGIDAAHIDEVVLTHLHYDHAGTLDSFPKARFHVQDAEMAYATGRCMCHGPLRAPYSVEDVTRFVRCVYHGRVHFHDGTQELAPGLTLHRTGGHSAGLQVVRVWTRRGWVVIASDATHFYANIGSNRSFPIVQNLADMLEGFRTVRQLADSDDHIIPGHDPLVMQAYAAPSAELNGIVVRLDEAPRLTWKELQT
jgi:glyoxylase-like metal-dependent hydrolase (beta-lactamase superfamily II)